MNIKNYRKLVTFFAFAGAPLSAVAACVDSASNTPNDGGISLGQAALGAIALRGERNA